MTVIGITGYAQHGKDSLGDMFAEIGFRKMAFADALRRCVATLDPVVGQYGERYSEVLAKVGYEEAKKLPEVRRLLQVMGTEVVRDILGEDSWVRALEKEWTEAGMESIVITDVRFPNEAEWVHRQGGTLIRVIRPLFENGVSREHPSELHIESLQDDVGVVATNLDELRECFQYLRQRESV